MSPTSSINRAAREGLIPSLDTRPLCADWRPAGVSIPLVRLANTIKRSPPMKPFSREAQWLDPARDTRAQLYQDEGFEHTAPFTDGNAYEIARFKSGKDDAGIVKYVGTWVEVLDGPGGSPVQLDYSNPYTLQDNDVNAQFLLRLQQGNVNTLGGAAWIGGYPYVQGYGYGQLPNWTDYRFWWGRYANHVWFLVPRNTVLRMYIRIISGANLVSRTLGRLQGYTQPAATLEAVENVSHGW